VSCFVTHEEVDFTVLEKVGSERIKILNHITDKKEWLYQMYFKGHPNDMPYRVDFKYSISEELPKITRWSILYNLLKMRA